MKRFVFLFRGGPPILLLTLILAGVGVWPGAMSPTGAPSPPKELVVTTPAPSRPDTTPFFDRPRGLVFRGLQRGAGACPSGWALMDRPSTCTHGPDRAPLGVDTTRV